MWIYDKYVLLRIKVWDQFLEYKYNSSRLLLTLEELDLS